MDWEQERYVRVYTRDTGDWLMLSFEAQCVWGLMLRRFDRNGRISVGRSGRRMLAAVLGHPAKQDLVDLALDELLADGCVTLENGGTAVFAPNFREAQDWVASPTERVQKHRAKLAEAKAAKALKHVTNETRETEVKPPPSVPTVPPVPPVPYRAVPTTETVVEPQRFIQPPSTAATADPVSFRDHLEADFASAKGAPYSWTPADDAAMGPLIGKSNGAEAEIRRRWQNALGYDYPRCGGLPDLVKHWNSYATPRMSTGPPLAPKPRDITRGTTRAEDFKGKHETGEAF